MSKVAFTFRLDRDLVDRVDAIRGKVSRTAWITNAMEIALAMRSALDEARAQQAPPISAKEWRVVDGQLDEAQGRSSSMPKVVGSPLDIPTVRRARELVTDEEALKAYRRVAGRKKWS